MKKQLAVLMAAATAVTTVAPVVANAAVMNTDAKTFVDTAKKALAETYADKHETGLLVPGLVEYKDDKAYLNSTNLVVLEIPSADAEKAGAKTLAQVASDLGEGVTEADVRGAITKYGVSSTATVVVLTESSKLENYLEGKNNVKMYVLKKGNMSGKSVVEVTKGGNQKYTSQAAVAGSTINLAGNNVLDGAADNLYKAVAKVERVTLKNSVTTISSFENNDALKAALAFTNGSDNSGADVKAIIYLKSGEKVELYAGMDALDFSAPMDKNGNAIKLSGNEEQSVLDSVAKFGVLGDAAEAAKVLYTPGVDSVMEYNFTDIDAVENIDLGTVYTHDNGYSETGADAVNHLREITAKNGTYNYKGDTYQRRNREVAAYEVTATDKGYTLSVTVPVISTNDDHVKKNLQFRITGVSHEDLVKVMNDLKNADRDVVAGRFKRLDGTDRYQTAIAVSKEKYENKDAESVVIVGGNALLDGLCAAPLASAKKAPVLLANPRTGLSADTLAEVKRATEKGGLKDKTVYIVGGMNSVPASVEKQLSDLGAVVIRVAGDDRYATSKAIAERLYYDGQLDPVFFFVGGNGAADALSVAPSASNFWIKDNKRMTGAILLVKKDGVPQDTRNFLVSKAKNVADKRAYIIGGIDNVSTASYKVLKEALGNTSLERISGADRYATNLALVDKFYNSRNANTGKFEYLLAPQGVVVASGKNNALVDAQVAGPFSAKQFKGPEKRLPILLVGDKLTDEQMKFLKDNKEALRANNLVYQVGGSVSSDAMKMIVDKLDIR